MERGNDSDTIKLFRPLQKTVVEPTTSTSLPDSGETTGDENAESDPSEPVVIVDDGII